MTTELKQKEIQYQTSAGVISYSFLRMVTLCLPFAYQLQPVQEYQLLSIAALIFVFLNVRHASGAC